MEKRLEKSVYHKRRKALKGRKRGKRGKKEMIRKRVNRRKRVK